MEFVCPDESMDSDSVQQQITNDEDVADHDYASEAFRERIEGILKFARLTTGDDLFFASYAYNPLGFAPSSIFVILQRLSQSASNWLVVKPGQYSDAALGHYSWGFVAVSHEQASVLCIRDSGSTHAPFAFQHLCRILGQAVQNVTQLEKQTLAQRLSVELGRQAQNETLLDTQAPGKSARNLKQMGNVDLDVNIFHNAADYTSRILKAQGCVIFDLIDFRMTHSDPNNSRSHVSASTSKTGASKGEEIKGNTSISPSSSSSSNFNGRSLPSITREHFVASGGRKTHCSFIPSTTPVRVLGHSGAWFDHFEKLSGDISKPLIAEYLSMTRYTGLNSKTFIEKRATPIFSLSNLAPKQVKTLICSSVAEADSQPAYLILALFEQENISFDQTEELFLEQMGAYLIYSSIRSRVVAVDRAQMRFTQRIQHELRTPLHAIIGVNEIAKQSLAHSFNLEEMSDLIDSIGTSADALNVLVDDMVDFSLMERLSGERKLILEERPSSDWQTLCGVIMSTCLRCYQLSQRMSRAEQKLGKHLSPPPEMFVTADDLYGFDWTLFKAQIDLEVIRRIIWKLVMNSLQATHRGLISITISRKSPRDSHELGMAAERLQIEVADTGRGMEEKFVEERLFQPFGKEDEESGGVGLSLTICQQLAAQMAGRLTAKSTVGLGTRMSVSIPLKHSSKVNNVVCSTIKRGPKVAFWGFDTFSKRLFVEKFLAQFHALETRDLNTARLVIMSFDDEHLQADYSKEIDVLCNRLSRAEIVIMPAIFLQELEEERSPRLEALQLSLMQDCRTIPRPMSSQGIQEMASLLYEVNLIETDSDMDSVTTNLTLPFFTSKSASPLAPPVEVPRRPSRASDRIMLDHPFTVLVVEDNPLNARIMTTMLKRASMNFILANDGKEGVELFKKHLPILVLLDINMPVMNGFEACQEMRKVTSPYVHRIVAITALSTEKEKRKGRECGMDEWLTKPTRMAPLMRDIKRRRREYEGVALSSPSTPSSTGVGMTTNT